MMNESSPFFDERFTSFTIPESFQPVILGKKDNLSSYLFTFGKRVVLSFPKIFIRNWVVIAVVGGLWLLLGFLRQYNLLPEFLAPLLFLTGGENGIVHPNVFQFLGGIISKGIILSCIIALKNLISGKKPLNLSIIPAFFRKFISISFDLIFIGTIVLGAGLGFCLQGFLCTDGRFINSFACIILIFPIIRAVMSHSGFLYGTGLRSLRKSPHLIDPLLKGVAGGLIISLPLTLLHTLSGISYYFGLGFMVTGLVLVLLKFILKKYNKKTGTLLIVFLMFLSGAIMSVSDSFAATPVVEVVVPDAVYAFEQFDLRIKVNSRELRKYKGDFIISVLDNINIGLRILSGPQRAVDGNYHGEGELLFKIQLTTDIATLTKIDFEIEFWTDQMSKYVLTVHKSTTLVPVELSVDLPKGYEFTKTAFDPFNGYYAKAEYGKLNYYDVNKTYYEAYEFRITYSLIDSEYWSGREYYEPVNGPMKPFRDYNSTLFDIIGDKTKMDVSKEILDHFRAEDGYYELYKNVNPIFPDPPMYDSRIQIGMVLFKGLTTVEIYLSHGLSNAPFNATGIPGEKEQEFDGIIRSIWLRPKTDNVPHYAQQLEIQSAFVDVFSENTVVAGAGDIVVTLASALFGTAAGALVSAGMSLGGNNAKGIAGGIEENIEKKLEDKKKREYRLIIRKNIESQLKYEQKVTLEAGIEERIYEENGSFTETMNPSLTDFISFSSPEAFVELSRAVASGGYKAVTFVAHSPEKGKPKAERLTITCMLVSPNGSHKQDVIFRIMGDAYIELKEQNLNILAASGRKFVFPFTLVDFRDKAEVSVNALENNVPFAISIEKNSQGQDMIAVTDTATKKGFESFFESYRCTIKAENPNEKAETHFDVVACHEGILPDFLGKPKEIAGYLVDPVKDEMAETLFYVRAGIWNENSGRLELQKPQNVKITLSDEARIFDLIKTDITESPDRSPDEAMAFVAKAEKCFPSMDPVEGQMLIQGSFGTVSLENEVKIQLAPDRLKYEQDYEKEYQACRRVILVYMAPRFQERKLKELEKAKKDLGIEDFRLFRKKCWSIAEQTIKQDGQEYVLDEAWYDEAIANLELAVYVGDIAFDLALSPIGGPITGFLAGQVKSSVLELLELFSNGSADKSTWDLTNEFIQSRLTQACGSLDGLIEMPGPDKPKELAIWLTCFALYRIGYHWSFTKENGEPIGICEAIKKGLMDFSGKGAGVLLGDFIKKAAKGHWTGKYSITDKDQQLVNQNVSKAVKTGLDSLDQAAKKADEALENFINILKNYLEQLKN